MKSLLRKGLLGRLLRHVTESGHFLTRFSSLQHAINQLSGNEETILLINRDETISTDLVIPENINLKFKIGSLLTINDGVTLTINSYIESGPWHIFNCIGTGKVVGISNEETFVEWFGAKGDGYHDDTNAMQKTLDSGAPVIQLLKGTYRVKKTLFLQYYQSLLGVGSGTSIIKVDDAFVGDQTIASNQNGGQYIIAQNTIDGDSWVQQFPAMKLGHLENFTIDASTRSNRDDIRGILSFGGARIDNIHTKKLSQVINVDGYFSDQVWIKRVHAQNSSKLKDNQGNWIYNIETSNLGDFNLIEQCHFPSNWDGVKPLGIKGHTNKSLNIVNCGNGSSYFKNSIVKIDSCYMEHTWLHFDNSHVTIINTVIKPNWTTGDENYNPNGTIRIENESHVVMQDVNIATMFKGNHQNFDSFGWRPDFIMIDKTSTLRTINVKHTHAYYGSIGGYRNSGIYIAGTDGNYIDDWSNWAGYLSKDGLIDRNHTIRKTVTIEPGQAIYLTKYTASNPDVWRIASGTYYYKVIILQDPIRFIGSNTGDELVYTLTNGQSPIPSIWFSGDTLGNANIIRILRGTQSGIYTHYADIPASTTRSLIDNGEIVNGFYWKEWGTQKYSVIGNISALVDIQGNLIGRSKYTPQRGFWKNGDYLLFETPIDTGDGRYKEAWRVTTSGWFPHSSETWKPNTFYVVGNKIRPTSGNGYYYECIQRGTTGTTEPNWTKNVGDTFTDGTCIWECKGPVGNKRTIYSIKTSTANLVFTRSDRGIVLTSPNGTQYRISVDDSGNLSTVQI